MPQGIGIDQSLNFEPSTFTVVVGLNNTIKFVDNDTTAPHNVYFTSVPSGASDPNAGAPSQMVKGQTYTVTLTTPGTYTYECQYHSTWQRGTITVSA